MFHRSVSREGQDVVCIPASADLDRHQNSSQLSAFRAALPLKACATFAVIWRTAETGFEGAAVLVLALTLHNRCCLDAAASSVQSRPRAV